MEGKDKVLMDVQVVVVNGRRRRSKIKFGREHITFFVDVPVGEADHFAKKCEVLGKTKSNVLRDLIQEFNQTFGYPAEDRVKDPGSLYERRAIRHIKEAVKEKIKREFPWVFSQN